MRLTTQNNSTQTEAEWMKSLEHFYGWRFPSPCHLRSTLHLKLKALCTKPCNCRSSISHFTESTGWREIKVFLSTDWQGGWRDKGRKGERDERGRRGERLTLLLVVWCQGSISGKTWWLRLPWWFSQSPQRAWRGYMWMSCPKSQNKTQQWCEL